MGTGSRRENCEDITKQNRCIVGGLLNPRANQDLGFCEMMCEREDPTEKMLNIRIVLGEE